MNLYSASTPKNQPLMRYTLVLWEKKCLQ